jgi:hypothetical protein
MSVLGPVRSTGKGLSCKPEDDPGGSWRGTIRQRVKYRAKWLSDSDADPASLPLVPSKGKRELDTHPVARRDGVEGYRLA